jgi:uncharacterized surface protein with fasciclin (FAS1) repeats
MTIFLSFQSILAGNIIDELNGVGATILVDYLVKANLSELLTDEERQFTLFAPINDAFEQLDPSGKKNLSS